MLTYTREQLATVLAVPLVSILLVWTIAIFHKNRKRWDPYDIPIVAIMVVSVVRNLTVLSYTLIVVLNQNYVDMEYCSVIVWIFNSVHTFQASSLTTLAVIGMFAAKLYRKRQNLNKFLTATHVVYHLFCLTTLCACVGVAAILAQQDAHHHHHFLRNPTCRFMPFQLDVKFNVFIIVLHIFLAIVSVASFLMICYHLYKAKMASFDYIKKSTSDLSELSYYDTYRMPPSSSYYGEQSDFSTTVSSTNSRRPCLKQTNNNGRLRNEEETRTGLETIHPVLVVCYLFYHLPLIGLCIFPRVIAPWPVSGAALWLGLLQDVLVPMSLGLVDTRFCEWVSRVYRCNQRNTGDKLPPQVGINGKFRHFGSQPQSLEPPLPTTERHKFPITNGSLYTSIDGRVPVIHNYRRQYKDRTTTRPSEPHLSLSMGIHATHLRRQQQTCCTCQHQLPKSFSQHSLLARNESHELRQSKSVDDVKNRFNQLQADDTSSEDGGGDYNNHTLSSESCCSITTDANCDFEFFQAKKPPSVNAVMARRASDFRITRSNSRRSLENFQAYVDEATGKLDVKCMKKGKSVEHLNESEQGGVLGSVYYGGSAPDFRKFFISEYI